MSIIAMEDKLGNDMIFRGLKTTILEERNLLQ